MKPVYLDYNATTPLDPEVAAAMRPYLEDCYGNPSSSHWYGIQARKVVEKARQQVSSLLGCFPDEIVFTSGGTESNNFALKGAAFARKALGNHIITSAIEHPAVMEVCHFLETQGFAVTYLPVNQYGMIDPDRLAEAIQPETILISVMHANNEVGTIQPICEIAEIISKKDILFHSDAAQTAGKIPVDVKELRVDLLSLAGHKIHAPKGIGALYIRRGVQLEKFMHGADHEQNLRAGTENVLEIVGLGKACEIAKLDLEKNQLHMKEMRDLLQLELDKRISDLRLNGHPEKRLPNTLSLGFKNLDANLMLAGLTDVAASAGAACHSGKTSISGVLTAMKVPLPYALGTIRFSTGKFTTRQDIITAAEKVSAVVNSLRGEKEKVIDQNLQEIKLTQFTSGLGCACKLRPQVLEMLISDLSIMTDPNILVGTDTADDAAVYKLSDNIALVVTVDFFTPVIDDPYRFGAVTAANALSDIYAMGATPLFALNIVAFPSQRLPFTVLKQILLGAQDKATEAGISIIGGHTIDDQEPKYGLAVIGKVHPDKILRNFTARPGDVLILTKPLGTGIYATALKKGLTENWQTDVLFHTMAELNKTASEIMLSFDISACTDVTGFGLLGHLREMTRNSKMDAVLKMSKIPLLPELLPFITANAVPGGTLNNLEFIADTVSWHQDISKAQQVILCDAQTSGGLLIAAAANEQQELLQTLQQAGVEHASCIGKLTSPGKGHIEVLP
ncbi:MAG: selenide, water dikinase SelD [Candidatus Cloacimonetes bacterium]|nr:selenide, water dikinase SelD [Candidatus Cloacimonadota bacterium]